MTERSIGTAAACEKCGATIGAAGGTCLHCFLGEGLESEGEASRQAFESVLEQADVPDQHWRLGQYEILEEIGRGGMGVIYRARQRHSRRIVALKRILAYQAGSNETLVRFRREAEAVAALDHPNIIPIYEVSESEDGLPFFSMKYAIGGSLRAAAPKLRSTPRESVRLLARVARAIAYAHEKGILHRDLQPGNILLDANGEPMVSDFGLAKLLAAGSDLTRTLTTFGTPGYIAPEQAESAAGDLAPTADVYSLGAILFHLLAGRPPFLGANVLSVIHQAAATPAPRLRSLVSSFDRDLETIVARCLEREPRARYQSAGALAEDLERWLEGRTIVARRVLPPVRLWRWARRNPILAGAATACLFLAGAVFWLLEEKAPPLTMSEKSIAVLPFENLSSANENAYLALGVQDEILSALSKVADLKVIARASVMNYHAGPKRDLHAIGRELGVAKVLEGRVRRENGKVRVTTQLVDTRTNTQLWAETYDRDVADVFAMQSEIAQAIAAQLQAKLSVQEKAAMAKPPTTDLTAFDLYTRAKAITLTANFSALGEEKLLLAADLLNQAVARDPAFFLAWCQLATVHDQLYFLGIDHTPARLALGESAMQKALQLQPDSGEAHLTRAQHFYRGYLDYERARVELAAAQRTLPNEPFAFELAGYIDRREGRWEESTRNLRRALQLDPRNFFTLQQIALSYEMLRRYPEMVEVLDQALSIAPKDLETRVARSLIDLDWHADPQPLHNTIAAILAQDPSAAPTFADNWLTVALSEHDPAAADRACAALDDAGVQISEVQLRRPFWQAMAARLRGDEVAARAAFTAARAQQEKAVRAEPDYAPALCVLGLIDAGLGRTDDALREGRRAMELLPVARDSINGAYMIEFFAMICAWTGEQDLAFEYLALATKNPGTLSYGQLKLHPFWDNLRGDPRFETIVASMAPRPVQPEKSVAVLPFLNLSADPESAFFAAGVQEDILTALSKIAELKVISRTSVISYLAGAPRDVQKIGRELGVSEVLEGSVRRVGGKVRVTAQLIETRTNTHVWAETYDRDLADVFAIQSEIATQIAAALRAQLAPAEKATLETKPTSNPEAYALYLQARGREAKQDAISAEQLYARAVALDPKFALAHARRSMVKSWFVFGSNAKQRHEDARAEAEEALRLSPSLGEAHAALGLCLYLGEKDYTAALKEFSIAVATLPNEPEILTYIGGIYRRQGRWQESLATFQRAQELDPRNADVVLRAANSHLPVRDWAGARAGYKRKLQIQPDSIAARLGLAYLEVCQNENPTAGRIAIQNVSENVRGELAEARWDLAMLERDYTTAEKISQDFGANSFPNLEAPASFFQGRTALARGDTESAQRYFTAAAPMIEERLREDPEDPDRHELAALLYAYMRRKEDALREAHRAMELEPESEDAFHGPLYTATLALVEAIVGDQDEAITLIERLLTTPGPIQWLDFPMTMTRAELRLRWEWDSLRGNPRFQQILAGPEPKTVLPTSSQH